MLTLRCSSFIKKLQESVKENYFERIIILQKCPQNIILIPKPPPINPFLRVFKWIKYIMNVYNYAGLKSGKNFEKKIIYVATGFGYMG